MPIEVIEVVDECELCKKNPEGMCSPCYMEALTDFARMTVLQHLFAMVICIFMFEFKGIYVEFCWTIERLFEIGDYAHNGYFEELGIDWRKPLI